MFSSPGITSSPPQSPGQLSRLMVLQIAQFHGREENMDSRPQVKICSPLWYSRMMTTGFSQPWILQMFVHELLHQIYDAGLGMLNFMERNVLSTYLKIHDLKSAVHLRCSRSEACCHWYVEWSGWLLWLPAPYTELSNYILMNISILIQPQKCLYLPLLLPVNGYLDICGSKECKICIVLFKDKGNVSRLRWILHLCLV